MNAALHASDRERVQACLDFLKTNPHEIRTEWRLEVQAEARALGLLPPEPPRIGQNCPPTDSPIRAYEAAILGRQERDQF